MLVNFVLNDKITWANVKTNSVWSRGSKYIITSLIGIGINVGVLDFFYYQLQFNHLLSNLIGISCAVFWNYTINNLWTWSTAKHNKTIIIERWTMRESLVEKTGSKCQYF